MRNPARHKRTGAAAAELALLLPFMVFIFVIGVDWARVFYYSQVIENCARNGAMYAADPKAPANNLYADVTSAALADASDLSPAPTVSSTTGTDADGNGYVAVTVSWTFKTLTNYPGDSNVSLSRTVKVRQAP